MAAQQNGGLDSEQEPRTARGVEERTKNKADKTEDDYDLINYDFEPVAAQRDL